jgi:hypothetical protein
MPMQAQRGGRGIALTNSQPWLQKGMHGQHHDQAAQHLGKTSYLMYSRLGGCWEQSGLAQKISPPL